MKSISELVQKLGNAGVTMADAPNIHKMNSAFEAEEVQPILGAIVLKHLKEWLDSREIYWRVWYRSKNGEDASYHALIQYVGGYERTASTEMEALSECVLGLLSK